MQVLLWMHAFILLVCMKRAPPSVKHSHRLRADQRDSDVTWSLWKIKSWPLAVIDWPKGRHVETSRTRRNITKMQAESRIQTLQHTSGGIHFVWVYRLFFFLLFCKILHSFPLSVGTGHNTKILNFPHCSKRPRLRAPSQTKITHDVITMTSWVICLRHNTAPARAT